jgi:hypothetical protein
METQQKNNSWIAIGLFYVVLVLIVTALDSINGVLRWSYWGTQVALLTVGVAIFIVMGVVLPNLSAIQGVLLAFTVGILTIIPAVLMGLGSIPGIWPQYFYIAFGMASGSFLTFLFLKFAGRISRPNRTEVDK